MNDRLKRLSGAEYKRKAKMKKEEQTEIICKMMKIESLKKKEMLLQLKNNHQWL